MKKALTIEDLKSRVGKPVFVVGLIYGNKTWRVLIGTEFAGVNILAFTDSSEIPKENQDKFRFFDEEVTALELKEILDAEEKEKKTGYERVEGAKYYTVSSSLEVNSYDDIYEFDEEKYKIANYFNDKNLTKNIARAEQLKYKLRRYAALNGDIPSQKDWKNYYCGKYRINYNYNKNEIDVYIESSVRDFGQIYFKNMSACEKAIEIFKHELMWYFTEYQEMLY